MAASSASAPSAEASNVPSPPGFGYRWTILALLFAATTINYVDRQVFSILAPTLRTEFGWTNTDYGKIASYFNLYYGIGLLLVGRLLDRIGVRRGFSFALVFWSLAAMGHALVRTITGFSLMRALLGLGEAANMPASVKTVAEWFPKRERALAVGLFNAGTNVGAVVAPLLVPFITVTWGWRAAFIVTGALGFLWLIAWLALYRDPDQHPRVKPAELAYIRSDPGEPAGKVSWLGLLKKRQAWAFIVGKAMTDPVWFFYLFWLPSFLDANYGVKLTGLAAPLIAIYVVADVGSVAGGWLSSRLIKKGWTVNAARKTALLIAALLIVPTMLAPHAKSMWVAVSIVCIAAAAHQWWSCNLFTSVSDMFPRRFVGSVMGLGGFAGAMAGYFTQKSTGRILDATGGDFRPIFVVCGLAYCAALLVMHLLVPRLEPAAVDAG